MFRTYEFDVKYSATYALARDTRMTADERKDVYSDFPKKIEELQIKLKNEIREYLKGLQTF